MGQQHQEIPFPIREMAVCIRLQRAGFPGLTSAPVHIHMHVRRPCTRCSRGIRTHADERKHPSPLRDGTALRGGAGREVLLSRPTSQDRMGICDCTYRRGWLLCCAVPPTSDTRYNAIDSTFPGPDLPSLFFITRPPSDKRKISFTRVIPTTCLIHWKPLEKRIVAFKAAVRALHYAAFRHLLAKQLLAVQGNMEGLATPARSDSSQSHLNGTERRVDQRFFFPRASGLARGKIRRAGFSEHSVKTCVWSMSR